MTIKVLVKFIEKEQLEAILHYYNSNKCDNEEPLESLNRCEGGFQIKLSYMKNYLGDDNHKIKQVRWKNGYLVSEPYISFTYKEKQLLYDSLVHVLGKDKVKIEDNDKNKQIKTRNLFQIFTPNNSNIPNKNKNNNNTNTSKIYSLLL